MTLWFEYHLFSTAHVLPLKKSKECKNAIASSCMMLKANTNPKSEDERIEIKTKSGYYSF